jgi:hydrogenase-1 operon protein HyaF
MSPASPKPFPVPVVSFQAAQGFEDDGLDVLALPSDMATFQPPPLPEPEALRAHDAARQALQAVCGALRRAIAGEATGGGVVSVSLNHLGDAERRLVNQVLGEGEVSAQVLPDAQGRGAVQIQESVFAGVWRVVAHGDDGAVDDRVEIGPVPAVLAATARADAAAGPGPLPPLPEAMVNVPSLLVELAEMRQHWRRGQPAEVINLSLLPLTPLDIAVLDQQLGTGRVLILSRGYGNCRITSTCRGSTWRVVYYNGHDKVILNAVEVIDVPEAACAAPEDLADSLERLTDVLAWVATA